MNGSAAPGTTQLHVTVPFTGKETFESVNGWPTIGVPAGA
jgi:hypothetical protein